MRHQYLGLDGVRGLAVLAVVLLHVGWLPWGWLGVDVFFALSGFLITGILLDAKGASLWAVAKPFYMRRALRILPLSLAVLAVVFWLAPALEIIEPTRWRTQSLYWSYLNNLIAHPRQHYLGHFWSLAVEEQFYLVWPWVVLSCSTRVLRPLCLVLAAASALMALMLAAVDAHELWFRATPFRLEGLALGAWLAIDHRKTVARWTDWRLLTWAPLRFVGTISYGIYVLHVPILRYVFDHAGTGLSQKMWVLGLTAGLSVASWYLFERQWLKLKSRWPMPGIRRKVAR